MSNYGVISAGNILLAGSNGSINFLGSLATSPQIGVLTQIFNQSFSIDDGESQFNVHTDSGASVARDAEKDYMSIRAPGDGTKAVLQSKTYICTAEGSSRIVTLVCNLNPLSISMSGVITRAGTFDDAEQKSDVSRGDGYFFSYSSLNGLAVVRRSSTDGTGGTDEVVLQEDFNLDKLDGMGLSKYTIDPSTANAFLIVHEYTSGVSSVKLGIVAGSNVVFAHRFDHSDFTVRTTSLPIRFEIENATGGTITNEMRVLSCGVSSSGGVPRGLKRSFGTKANARDVSSFASNVPVVSCRLKNNYVRASVKITGFHLTATANTYYELVLNPSVTNPSWVDASSTCEIDTSATDMTGGTVVLSGYASANETVRISVEDLPPLSSSIAGEPEVYTVNAVSLMSSGLVWSTLEISEVM